MKHIREINHKRLCSLQQGVHKMPSHKSIEQENKCSKIIKYLSHCSLTHTIKPKAMSGFSWHAISFEWLRGQELAGMTRFCSGRRELTFSLLVLFYISWYLFHLRLQVSFLLPHEAGNARRFIFRCFFPVSQNFTWYGKNLLCWVTIHWISTALMPELEIYQNMQDRTPNSQNYFRAINGVIPI